MQPRALHARAGRAALPSALVAHGAPSNPPLPWHARRIGRGFVDMDRGFRRKTTRVVRNRKKTVLNALFAIAIGAFALAILMKGKKRKDAYVWGPIAALPAVFFAYRALSTSASAECPACEMHLFGLSTRTNCAVFCETCGQFMEGEKGALWITPDERVLGWPAFTAELPETIQWPEGCCVCGAPATRTVEARLVETRDTKSRTDLAVRLLTVDTVKIVEKHTFSVPVPHCQEHHHGAALYSSAHPEQDRPSIGFRWYKYMRLFCELNRTRPRPRWPTG